MEKGYIHLYTGDGKGKTTAALGLALRAAGAGLPVWIGQFVKGSLCAEHSALKRFEDLITIKIFGRSGFIVGTPDPADIAAAKRGLEEAEKILTGGNHQVVIMDEVCIALHFNLFSMSDLLPVIQKKRETVELILTGRYAPQALIDTADLVTEMHAVKHYYQRGVQARKGIED